MLLDITTSSVFFLPKSQYVAYCKEAMHSSSIEESILTLALNGLSPHPASSIPTSAFIKHPFRSYGNFILIPFEHAKCGCVLTPWAIIDAAPDHTTLLSAWPLSYCSYARFPSTTRPTYAKSFIHEWLDILIQRFPEGLSPYIRSHLIPSSDGPAYARIWLPSWQDLDLEARIPGCSLPSTPSYPDCPCRPDYPGDIHPFGIIHPSVLDIVHRAPSPMAAGTLADILSPLRSSVLDPSVAAGFGLTCTNIILSTTELSMLHAVRPMLILTHSPLKA